MFMKFILNFHQNNENIENFFLQEVQRLSFPASAETLRFFHYPLHCLTSQEVFPIFSAEATAKCSVQAFTLSI